MYSSKIASKNKAKMEEALGRPLREYSFSEVDDFSHQMRDIHWNEQREPSRPLTEEEQIYIFNEIHLSRLDFTYWLTRYCKILSDEKRITSVIPWPSQKKIIDILAKEEERQEGAPWCKIPLALLKSRQVGGTVIGEAIVAHLAFLFPITQGLIASDHEDTSLKLYQTLTMMYDNIPGWMRPVIDGRVKGNHLHFPLLRSDVIVGSGNQTTTIGQGLNIDVAHLTELSTWMYPSSIDADLLPAFLSSHKHHSVILMESTGAGAKGNWFHDHFMAAWMGDSTFKAVFAAWFLRPSNKLDATGVEFLQTTQNMAHRVKQESGVELSREQLAWYQITRRDLEVKDKLWLFYQEYPSTIEEAFQTGLRSVFPIELRSKMRDSVREPLLIMEMSPDGTRKEVNHEQWMLSEEPTKYENKLIIWEPWKAGHLYTIGVDGAYGIEGGDLTAVEVLRVGNKIKPDEQVAEWAGTWRPPDVAVIVEFLGNRYRDRRNGLPALVACEANPGSPSLFTQLELIKKNYLNFYMWDKPLRMGGGVTKEVGWWTTQTTRPLITETLLDYTKQGNIVVNSPEVIKEMGSFVNVWEGRGARKLEHAPGYHDDRLFALGIALYVSHERDMVILAEERRKYHEQRRSDPGVKKGKEMWEVMGGIGVGQSYESVIDAWEDSLVDSSSY